MRGGRWALMGGSLTQWASIRCALTSGRLAQRALMFTLAFALASASCSSELQLNLIVFDSCQQFPLDNPQLDTLDVRIGTAQGSITARESFDFDLRRGDFDDIEPIEDAVLSVVASAGATPQAAASVGLIDLSGEDGEDPLEVSIVIGNVDSFIRTTNTAQANQCSEQIAARRRHTATLLPDGRVFIAGGFDASADFFRLWTTNELYDPVAGVFGPVPELAEGREGHTATRLNSGEVLLAGGQGSDATLSSTEIYEPSAGRIGGGPELAEPRAYHTATLLGDGSVLLVGGAQRLEDGTLRYLGTTSRYQPDGSVVVGRPLSGPRAFHTAIQVSPDTVAVIGGLDEAGLVARIEFVSANAAIVGAELAVPRSHAAAALIPGTDTMVIAGGFGVAPQDPRLPERESGTASVEIVELRPDAWEQSVVACERSLRVARGDAAIAPRPGGLLLAGGVSASGASLSSAEVLTFGADPCAGDPADIDLSPGELNTARAGSRLTPLIGGDVLVSGGYQSEPSFDPADTQDRSLAAAEIYIVPR